jgi:hypothetical protein
MSPEGMTENDFGNVYIRRRSVVPAGLPNIVLASNPSDKSLGYFQMSLWDKPLRHSTFSAIVLEPKASHSHMQYKNNNQHFQQTGTNSCVNRG